MGFQTLQEVEAWAESNGGEDGLREAMAAGVFGSDKRTLQNCNEWLRLLAQSADDRMRNLALASAIDSATSAKQSAKWTMVAALATMATAFIMLAQALGWLK